MAATCYSYYPKKVIYSLPQNKELKKDNWRVFLVNNYNQFDSNVTSIKSIVKKYGIEHTLNLFDNIDKLYGKKEGAPAAGGEAGGDTGGGSPAPPPGGDTGGGAPAPPPEGDTGMPTERLVRNDLDLILENTLFNSPETIDLSKGRNSLVEIEKNQFIKNENIVDLLQYCELVEELKIANETNI